VIAASVDWKVISIAAVLLLVAMVLLYRLMNRDPNVHRTRYGFFVERDRFPEPIDPWRKPEDTMELPPKKEER
jgi:hypothetical protein